MAELDEGGEIPESIDADPLEVARLRRSRQGAREGWGSKELKDLLSAAVDWHQVITMGRFDDIPNRQSRLLEMIEKYRRRYGIIR